jgi:hypothetical protein
MQSRNTQRSDELRRRLREVVPGGAHTYAKGDDQYPDHLAPIIERGRAVLTLNADATTENNHVAAATAHANQQTTEEKQTRGAEQHEPG